MLPKHISGKILLLLLGDAFFISTAHVLSPAIRLGAVSYDYVLPSLAGFSILAVYLFTFYTADLYEFDRSFKSPKYLFRFLVALFVAGTVEAALIYYIPPLRASRGIYLIGAVLVGVLTYSWRLLFEWAFSGFLKRQWRIIIVGAGQAGKALYDMVKDNPAYRVVGFIDDESGKWGLFNTPEEIIGDFTMLDEMVSEHKVDAAVIAITHEKAPHLLKSALLCKMKGVPIYDMAGFYEEVTGKVPVEHVDDLWFVTSSISGVQRTIYNQRGKRMLDLACSLAGLLIGLPFMLIAAGAIKLDSKGAVFYTQRRVGLNGAGFDFIKFRSMKTGAEENGAVWAGERDERVTRVGRVMRSLRIDEMPQMWNVLKGEMSFIGPRPERPEFVEPLNEKIPYYSLRHSVKPGLTGWAQVNHPYGASEKDALDKLQYDLYYIKNLSPLLDFHILLKTVKVVLFGRGAR